MLKLSTFKHSSMTNAYHVSSHASFLNLLTNHGAADLGISATLLTDYQAAIEREQEAVKRAVASDKTPAIRLADETRDRLFRFIRNTLSNMENSPDAATAAAFATIKTKVLDLYPAGIVHEADNVQTAHVRGFIVDINEYLEPSLRDAIGISTALSLLADANETFQQRYLERIDELAAAPAAYTKECRTQVDALYRRIVTSLEYRAARTDATDETERTYCTRAQAFIGIANELIARIWQAIRQGRSLAASGTDARPDATDPTPGADPLPSLPGSPA